jgi:hypothetical protein
VIFIATSLTRNACSIAFLALERALNNTIPSDDDSSVMIKGKWKAPEDTIQEEAEPMTPGPSQTQMPRLHLREHAE